VSFISAFFRAKQHAVFAYRLGGYNEGSAPCAGNHLSADRAALHIGTSAFEFSDPGKISVGEIYEKRREK